MCGGERRSALIRQTEAKEKKTVTFGLLCVCVCMGMRMTECWAVGVICAISCHCVHAVHQELLGVKLFLTQIMTFL